MMIMMMIMMMMMMMMMIMSTMIAYDVTIPLPPELVDSVEYVNQLPGTRLNLSEGR